MNNGNTIALVAYHSEGTMNESVEELSSMVAQHLKPVVERFEHLFQEMQGQIGKLEVCLSLIQSVPHQWSERPCQTCSTITGISGIKFGCDFYREMRENTRRNIKVDMDVIKHSQQSKPKES